MVDILQDTDKYTGAFLLVGGIAGLLVALLIGFRRTALYWSLAGIAMIYLCFDEWRSLHEKQGWWLESRGWDIPGLTHVDSAILLAIFMAGAIATWLFRDELFAHPRVLAIFLAAAVISAFAFAVDAFLAYTYTRDRIEEFSEAIAALLFALGFLARLLTAARVSPLFASTVSSPGEPGEEEARAGSEGSTAPARPR